MATRQRKRFESFAKRFQRLSKPEIIRISRNDENLPIEARRIFSLSKFEKTYALPHHLPKIIGSLDIETWKTNFQNPEKSELAIAGLHLFQLNGEKYVSKGYRSYTIEQLENLHSDLVKVPLIIGHNILEFDYRVLSRWMDLNGIVDKTVDTLFFLWMRKKNRLGGLSLKNLCQLNHLRGRKWDLGAAISSLWKRGEINSIVQYNKNDCRITKELWWHLITKRKTNISHELNSGQFIKLKSDDIPYLLGRTPIYTYSTWRDSIDSTGYVWKSRSAPSYLEVSDNDLEESAGRQIFLRLSCRKCPRYFIFVTHDDRDWSKCKEVPCPACGTSLPIISEHGRFTPSCRVICKVLEKPKFVDPLNGKDIVPFDYISPEQAREFIERRAKRFWERWMPIK